MMESERVKTIHCSQGITEKDIRTYFTKFQDGSCGWREARETALFLQRYSSDIWQHATLSVRGQDGTVCFVSGRGTNKFHIVLDKTETQIAIRATFENLLLGFFRLFVAVACLAQGSLVAMAFTGQSSTTVETTMAFIWEMFVYTRDTITLTVAAAAAIDTVYGPVALFGSWTGGTTGRTVQKTSLEQHQKPAELQEERGNLCTGAMSQSEKPDVSSAAGKSSEASPGRDARHEEGTGWTLRGHCRWFLRAGLYWTIASSSRPKDIVFSDALADHGITVLAFVPGFILFWAGVLSLLAQGLLIVFPGFLLTPWAVTTQQAEMGRNTAAKENVRRRHSATRVCRNLTVLTSTVLNGALCANHVIRIIGLTKRPTQLSDVSGDMLKMPAFLDGGHGDDIQRSATHSLKSMFIALIPAMSSLSVCAYLLLWSSVALVKGWRDCDRHRHMLTWPWTLFTICGASTLWAAETVETLGAVFGESLTGGDYKRHIGRVLSSENSETESASINQFESETRIATTIVSAAAIVISVIVQIFRYQECLRSLKSLTLDSLHAYLAKSIFSRDSLLRFAHALAVLLAICCLGLALVAMPLPWLNVCTSYSSDFQPMTAALRNVSMQMSRHALAMDALLALSVCQEDEMSVLSSDISSSKDLLSRISVDQIENFCLKFECQNHGALKTDNVRHVPSQHDHPAAAFCDKFCYTWAYFQGNVDFNASVHRPLAREVKGNPLYETIHLKSVIVDEKTRFITELENRASQEQTHVINFQNVDMPHSACKQALCALRTVSSVGLAAPLLGFTFHAMHVAVQAMLMLLGVVMRAQELRAVFDDFQLRLDALALYLEHGVEERIVTLSIYNYSLIYLAYPALLTGCVGVLGGFWHRRGAALGRRCRSTMVVVLPLMVMNVFGLGMTVAWTRIVECLSSLVTLVHVTSYPQAGAHALLAAFMCGACSCAMLLVLTRWDTRHLKNTVSDMVTGRDEDVAKRDSDGQTSSILFNDRAFGLCSDNGSHNSIARACGRANDTGSKLTSLKTQSSGLSHDHCRTCKSLTDQPKVRMKASSDQSIVMSSDLSRGCRRHDSTAMFNAHAREHCNVQVEASGNTRQGCTSVNEAPTSPHVHTDHPTCNRSQESEDRSERSINPLTDTITGTVNSTGGCTHMRVKQCLMPIKQLLKLCENVKSKKSVASTFRRTSVTSDGIQGKMKMAPWCDSAKNIYQSTLSSGTGADTSEKAVFCGEQTSPCERQKDTSRYNAAIRHHHPRRFLCCGGGWGPRGAASGGSWLLGGMLACLGCLLVMLTCVCVPAFTANVNLRQDFESLITELSQGGTAVEVGRRVLLSRDDSCDVIDLVGREVLRHYVSTLEDVKVKTLITELHVLRAKAKVSVDTILPLIMVPCLVSSLLGCGLVLAGALSSILHRPGSSWTLTSKGASKAVHRLTLLSLAWLLHASLAMSAGGPAASAAVPAIVQMHVHLSSGFVLALGSHVLLLLASLELRLSSMTPLL